MLAHTGQGCGQLVHEGKGQKTCFGTAYVVLEKAGYKFHVSFNINNT